MKRMLPRPIFIYLKSLLEVLLSKMTDPNRQYIACSQVFRFEESIHVLFLQANFSLNFHFPVESFSFFFFLICVLSLDMCLVSSPSKAYKTPKTVIVAVKRPCWVY